MSMFDKFIKNCDLSDLNTKSQKSKKPWVVSDIMENPNDFYMILFTDDDAVNVSIRKRPVEHEEEETNDEL